MSNPLAEYLSALEARDAREKAHQGYVDAYSKLADRTATLARQPPAATEEAAPSPSVSTKTLRPGTPKGKPPLPPPDTSSPSTLAQLRSELASTHRTRSALESQVTSLTTTLAALQASDATQKQRITQLEKTKVNLERRGKDRAEELKGKGRFVEEVQDEMVALNLQLNMAEQEKERLKRENEELTKRWVSRMEEEASKMNDRMGWQDGEGRVKGEGKGKGKGKGKG
ncbi:autophagy protein 16 [Dothidotthia symphoricarpi CBS 119687]|uniref:Autophagy protein 16 n=1 Tax=Dothidotthia symphoricarpi CBS 119687 TaxID=1392245 RepID=A0A6A6A7A5_9PLEO|nr:autophagy protein 16 [Dothidotthia symphoricarpi CBS 119687]KAF2127023.1 autophagy protein 16 [Dothidotthia symphoricarpi CBS 119687]